MTTEKLIEIFIECWNESTTDEKVQVHNAFAINHRPDDEIFINDEEFFNLAFEGRPFEAVRSAFFGHYKYSDNYVWFNGYANLDSSDYEDEMPLADKEELAEYFIEHYMEIDHISSMADFVSACEGYEDEEEDEENEED